MNETFAAPAASAAEPDLQGRTVWAIDTLSRIYQLFHALPEMAAPDGTPVSAVSVSYTHLTLPTNREV